MNGTEEITDCRNAVGRFFEPTICRAFGAEQTAVLDGDGVIYTESIAAGIEIKSANDGDRFKIDVVQFENHLKLLIFPLDTYLYVLCGYRNRQGRRGKLSRNRLVGKIKTIPELESFLTVNFNTIFIIDIAVLVKLREEATSGSLFGKKNQTVIELSRKKIRQLADSGEDVFVDKREVCLFRENDISTSVKLTAILTGTAQKLYQEHILPKLIITTPETSP
jgi:hypothetical protein